MPNWLHWLLRTPDSVEFTSLDYDKIVVFQSGALFHAYAEKNGLGVTVSGGTYTTPFGALKRLKELRAFV